MITKIYIDNFRCFVNFEYKLIRKQLVIGDNGSGKSSFLDAIFFIRQFVNIGNVLEDYPIINQQTRWQSKKQQTFEVEAEIDEAKYKYKLVIEPWGEFPKTRVQQETVHLDGKPIFEFLSGEVHLYNDRFEHKVTYDFDWHRSALATIMARKDNQKLYKFKEKLSNLLCFKINPFVMESRSGTEDLYPDMNLSNVASWYRHLIQSDPQQNAKMIESLRSCMDGFNYLQLESVGENNRLLTAEFEISNGNKSRFLFEELSDGQRCIICLYIILHFIIAKGFTVIIDEPDNFISLREIQPWLSTITDIIDEADGQIILISHHPEAINQWAPQNGVLFIRNAAGPVRVEKFQGDPNKCLTASEIIARGWDHE